MGIISYAQNFEDVMLWRALGGIGSGFYIDVGAFHPVIDSVSKLFYEKGWRGIHVEPLPHMADLLRADRPDEEVIQSVVSDTNGIMKLYDMYGLTTGVASIAQMHNSNRIQACEISVPCVTLDDIFLHAQGKEIHWLKIDVEGMEAKLLAGWKSKRLPWITMVESTIPNSKQENWQEWDPILKKKGYNFVFFDGLNRYYISPEHPELKDAFYAGPNIFDQFYLHGDSSAPFCNHINDQSRKKENELHNIITQHQANIDALHKNLSEQELRYDSLTQAKHIREKELLAQGNAKDAEHQQLTENWQLREQSLQELLEHTKQATARELAISREESALRDKNFTAMFIHTQQELVGKATELATAQQQLAGKANELANMQQQAKELQQEFADYKHASAQQIQMLRSELAHMQSTLLWKITAPLREMAKLLGQIKPLAEKSGKGLTNFADSMQVYDKFDKNLSNFSDEKIMTIESVQQLLDLNGSAFIEAAYRSLLNRSADPQGRDYYLGRMQVGYSKAEVIYQMTRSGEYKVFKRQLHGLPELCAKEKRAANKLFKSDQSTVRRINSLEYTLTTQMDKLRQEVLSLGKKYSVSGNGHADGKSSHDARDTTGSVLAQNYDNLSHDPSGIIKALEKRIAKSEEAFVLSKL